MEPREGRLARVGAAEARLHRAVDANDAPVLSPESLNATRIVSESAPAGTAVGPPLGGSDEDLAQQLLKYPSARRMFRKALLIPAPEEAR